MKKICSDDQILSAEWFNFRKTNVLCRLAIESRYVLKDFLTESFQTILPAVITGHSVDVRCGGVAGGVSVKQACEVVLTGTGAELL